MNLEERAQRIQELRKKIKEAEIEREEHRNFLMQQMDLMADPPTETHMFPQELFKNGEEILEHVINNMPGTVLLDYEYTEDGWKVVVRLEHRYVPISMDFEDIVVNRTISQPTPTIDLEKLNKIDPVMTSQISEKKTTLELNENALQDWIKKFPGDIYKLQKVLKSKKPSAVLRISEKKEKE